MVRHARPLLRGRLRRPNLHQPVNRHRVAADDLAGELRGEGEGICEGAFRGSVDGADELDELEGDAEGRGLEGWVDVFELPPSEEGVLRVEGGWRGLAGDGVVRALVPLDEGRGDDE